MTALDSGDSIPITVQTKKIIPIFTNSMQQVPTTYAERQQIRSLIDSLPLEGQPLRQQLEQTAKTVIENEDHLAWAMVLVGSKLWKCRVINVPYSRRLLLLPHCMRNAEKCSAPYDAEGLHCKQCGNCELGHLKSVAEHLGYRVLIAEGSPVVMQWILAGKANAILGVGCLRSLEKAFDKLQLAGIPALAVPLYRSGCKETAADIDWVLEMIQTPFEPAPDQKPLPSWIPLLRSAANLFVSKSEPISDEPAKQTESLALDFLHCGGKFYRPFITLATFDALTGSHGTAPDGEKYVEELPDWVKNVAKTVEVFHKASLIHDDIEDNDLFRYGKQTLHDAYGTPVAINAGDYLLGFGYRTIAELRHEVDDKIVTEMLSVLSSAHCKLCIGQGTELAWKAKKIIPAAEEILRFYVGKTAPAFEAALYIGVLAATAAGGSDWSFYDRIREHLARFSRHLGAAFQIKNDLDDWFPDELNKKVAGSDAAAQRPTLIHAWAKTSADVSVTEMFEKCRREGLFDQARRLAAKYSGKARETAFGIDHEPLQKLLLYFVEALG